MAKAEGRTRRARRWRGGSQRLAVAGWLMGGLSDGGLSGAGTAGGRGSSDAGGDRPGCAAQGGGDERRADCGDPYGDTARSASDTGRGQGRGACDADVTERQRECAAADSVADFRLAAVGERGGEYAGWAATDSLYAGAGLDRYRPYRICAGGGVDAGRAAGGGRRR